MKSSRASSRVNMLKCSSVSRTNSVPIFRVPGSNWCYLELVPETLEQFNALTRLLARENFIVLFSDACVSVMLGVEAEGKDNREPISVC
jgi:hypothetical protein